MVRRAIVGDVSMFKNLIKLVEALATACGVVLGLTPDPTRVSVRYDD
jgi:hypothetical protein